MIPIQGTTPATLIHSLNVALQDLERQIEALKQRVQKLEEAE